MSTLPELREEYVARGVSTGNLNVAKSAKNSTIITKDGKEFIDFAGAIGVMNVGHSHPKVIEAIKAQVEHFTHPGFNVIMYEGYVEVCRRLCEITAGDHKKKALLLNSGAEAVENAVKISRKYTGRSGVVVFNRAFHGRTNLTMGMTSKVKPYKEGFGPFNSDVFQAPFPFVYERPSSMTEDEYIDEVIARFKEFFKGTVCPSMIACVVMEPVQGEGGFIIPPKRFVEFVYNFCQEHGIVFVADEIQAGFCRTGKLFAMEHFGIVPDLMTTSKSLAAGMPLSAVVGRAEIINEPTAGQLGGTFAGNPIACAAALAVMDIVEEESLNEKSEALGAKLEAFLVEMQKDYSFIGDIRRLGAMVAAELTDPATGLADSKRTSIITKYANDNGLLLLSAGLHGNVIRFLSPLTITDEELAKGLAILKDALAEASKQ
ncbi:4-aminobutyrate--2-oxoglutarate transaminase [Wohlfahrtiimonas chitiniclastica]|uniref:Putative 4-aminobutyrate aminotransferase n=1 Tax=Wohlfahrtiimonas chitiniclastica SH04 TaxID=1261130 RepID=L8Y1R3_9GAMM|nr:4-aminobutyrate--2-oxoglutarate transaminase [Wohlfahrtiimonas chitiniclastica]ELV08890.1 Putative 4-aminobutyrate aminotransferase [Wohlfahrtiimonas chitiniclastica SH04]KZS22568.1 4-aminobutyrate transaminase [Wohlfahrtiimonas chitiniclastica]KZX38069.1 4-aminobutyrate--2-oxoglutarate transaminase [Wohlfahrtiimonas chitiniclastica]MBS7816118.1 4-aminobutyrate--2-oxoglutarate transaminase [Wohlfahrtiimonas chitiniclastica]MBS7817751.1 4-aminobutyrate--2-oxoglutarate transaminase [Wohlfahrt